MKIVVLHLDLGIGGAEKLMVNLSVAAQQLNHEVGLRHIQLDILNNIYAY